MVVLNSSEDGEGDQPSVHRRWLLQIRLRLGRGICSETGPYFFRGAWVSPAVYGFNASLAYTQSSSTMYSLGVGAVFSANSVTLRNAGW